MKKEEGIKVLNLVVKNFKNIEKTEVDFAGRSATIIGKNGAGKSSLIQAICSPVNGKYIPSVPIKKGEERGSIELKIGGKLDGREEVYTLDLQFSERHNKGKITITNSDGDLVSGGKRLISEIVGNIGFDIQEFIKLGVTSNGSISKPGVQEQIEILKGLMPEDIVIKMHGLDLESKEVYDDRTDINRDIKYAKSKLEGHEYSQEELEFYAEAKDTKSIVTKMSGIEKELEDFNKVSNGVDSTIESINKTSKDIDILKKELELKQSNMIELSTKLEKGRAWLLGKTKPSIEALNNELLDANQHNAKFNEIKELGNSQSAIRKLESSSEKMTARLESIKTEKKDIFASSPLPVKDLTFDEEGIYYKGLPFHEDQHPTSVIIGIGVKVAMALNPNLKLLIIRDGSLLDDKTLTWILKQCDKDGYQIFIERVNDNEEVDIEFIETKI